MDKKMIKVVKVLAKPAVAFVETVQGLFKDAQTKVLAEIKDFLVELKEARADLDQAGASKYHELIDTYKVIVADIESDDPEIAVEAQGKIKALFDQTLDFYKEITSPEETE